MIFDRRPVSARLVPPLQIPADASPHTEGVLRRMQQSDLAVSFCRTSTTDRVYLRVVDQQTGKAYVSEPGDDSNLAVDAWMDAFAHEFFAGEEAAMPGLHVRAYLIDAAEGEDSEYPYHPANLRESYDDWGMARAEE